MTSQARIPRRRGAICGALLILLGIWGGLAPFVGPYFHFGFTPDKAWAYTSGRLYYSVIPGAAALLGGLMILLTRNRAVGITGGILAALGGAWFGVGEGFVAYVLKRPSITIGGPLFPANSSGLISFPLRSYLETLSLFTGLGFLIVFAGAVAIGRFSMLAAQDVVADEGGEDESYYTSLPAVTRPAAGGYGTAAGQFPSGAEQYAGTGPFSRPTQLAGTAPDHPDPASYPEGAQFPGTPMQFPDTTTAQFPPPEGGS
jgi:hypothetical protein